MIASRQFGSQSSFSHKGGFGVLLRIVGDRLRCHDGPSRSLPERRGRRRALPLPALPGRTRLAVPLTLRRGVAGTYRTGCLTRVLRLPSSCACRPPPTAPPASRGAPALRYRSPWHRTPRAPESVSGRPVARRSPRNFSRSSTPSPSTASRATGCSPRRPAPGSESARSSRPARAGPPDQGPRPALPGHLRRVRDGTPRPRCCRTHRTRRPPLRPRPHPARPGHRRAQRLVGRLLRRRGPRGGLHEPRYPRGRARDRGPAAPHWLIAAASGGRSSGRSRRRSSRPGADIAPIRPA